MESKKVNAFSNPVRLKILCCLSKKSSNVNELVDSCGLAQSAVSQHLIKLKSAGLVTTKRRGKYIYYLLKDKKTGNLANDFYNFCSGEVN